jgi:very-short-patch-repair endonuclease
VGSPLVPETLHQWGRDIAVACLDRHADTFGCTNDKLYRNRALNILEMLFARANDGCDLSESPIETAMLTALTLTFGFWCVGKCHYERNGTIVLANDYDDLGNITIHQQIQLGDFRADILLENRINNIIVECDGHDFHERTKQQARRDRARDRWLQTLGLIVFRFTGSEIWRDAAGCADEVLVAALDIAKRKVQS